MTTPKITIAIPAHNEGRTIRRLLKNIASQTQEKCSIEKIVVYLDGCTDNTKEQAESMSSALAMLTIVDDGMRVGKPGRMDQIFAENLSEILVTLDADIEFASIHTLDRPVEGLATATTEVLSVGREIPHPNTSFFGKIVYHSQSLWDEVRFTHNNGKSIHALHGQMYAIKKEFAQGLHLPKGMTSDSGFMFIHAMKSGGIVYVRDALIRYHTVTTWEEYRAWSTRANYDEKKILIQEYGPSILELYTIPRSTKFAALFRYFCRYPFWTLCAIGVNLLVRHMPVEDELLSQGYWHQATSTKR